MNDTLNLPIIFVAVLLSQNEVNDVSHLMLLELNAGHPLVNAIHPPIPNSP